MSEWKKRLLQTTVCLGLLIVVWGSYIIVMNRLERRIVPCKDDFLWVYQVDSAETKGKELVLCGFAFPLDKNATEGGFEIVLQDISSGENFFPKMKYRERRDVNNYFLCEYDYLQSGFEATIKVKKLDLQTRNYEVLLRMIGEKKAYRTGTYLAGGQLVYADPAEFKPLETAGTDLEEIVTNGALRVYRPDYGMYVYQYGGELYWIAEPEYGFDEGGDTYVQYQLDTTQVDRLPEERLAHKWYWDNIGFRFCEKELSEWNTGKYRVAAEKIPTEYSVEKMWTGNYKDDRWIWQQSFRPYYQFIK